jgi:hypothetical protein
MLNTVLTVRKADANSHKGQGWETFTDAVIRELNARKKGIVFLLWGKPAEQKCKAVDKAKHFVLTVRCLFACCWLAPRHWPSAAVHEVLLLLASCFWAKKKSGPLVAAGAMRECLPNIHTIKKHFSCTESNETWLGRS